MFLYNCKAEIPKDMNNAINNKYANIRYINMNEYNNKFNFCSATFSNDRKYYKSININNITEKEIILQMYENEKFFGEEENNAVEEIIKKIAVDSKDNFFSYYD